MTKLHTLTQAVKAAIANGCDRSVICVPAWSRTYGLPMKTVREVWEAQLTRLPPNTDSPMEGK